MSVVGVCGRILTSMKIILFTERQTCSSIYYYDSVRGHQYIGDNSYLSFDFNFKIFNFNANILVTIDMFLNMIGDPKASFFTLIFTVADRRQCNLTHFVFLAIEKRYALSVKCKMQDK